MEYRLAAGVIGLVALVILIIFRRTTSLGASRWTPSRGSVQLVLAGSFAAARVLLGGNSVLGLIGGSRQGVGAELSAGVVAGVASLLAVFWAARTSRIRGLDSEA